MQLKTFAENPKNNKIKNKGLIDAWVVLELSFVQEQLVQNNGSKWCLQITAAHFSDIAVPEFELPAIDDSDRE